MSEFQGLFIIEIMKASYIAKKKSVLKRSFLLELLRFQQMEFPLDASFL